MSRRLISSGSSFEQEIGYSRAVVDGEWIFVSGCTGFDYATMTLPEGIADQAEQALRNVRSALDQAGASLNDVVRVLYIVPRAEEFSQCWPVLRKHLGEARPAATMISAALLDPRMRIEIEVTARRAVASPAPLATSSTSSAPAADVATTGFAALPLGSDEVVMGDDA